MRILIIEDDERIASFMRRGLEAEDYEVDVASGQAHAIALIQANTYNLLIIDIFLGPDDGLELCQSLRRQHIESPILIMTAKGTLEMEAATQHAGANAYLAKPFAFEDLMTTIAHLCTTGVPSSHFQEAAHHNSPLQTDNRGSIYKTQPVPSNEHEIS